MIEDEKVDEEGKESGSPVQDIRVTESQPKSRKSLDNKKPDGPTSVKKPTAKVIETKYESDDDDIVPELPPECCEGFDYQMDDSRKNPEALYSRNQMSVPWFQKINIKPGQRNLICFSESLLMVDESGRIAGKMYTSVSESKWGEKICLCAHSGSFGTLSNGLECGTTITGFVSFDMTTLQEYVYEWAIYEGKVIERKTFIMREDEITHVRIVLIKDGKTAETKVVNLSKLEQQNLITESSHIILLRLLLLEKRTNGGMELKTLTFQGKVVKNKYGELGNGWENVKGEQMKTWSIRRTVEFDFGDRLWDSMLNEHCRLILRCQPENTHALIPLWFEPVKEFKDGNFVGSYPPYVWACDAELYAKYLLKKDELAAEHRSYLLDHPELRALMSDFVQALLLEKPDDVVPFAQDYFHSFAKIRPATHNTTTNISTNPSASTIGSHGDMGEWQGESGNEPLRYYPMRPTISDDGLEKMLPDEFTSAGEQDASTDTADDSNVSVGPDGKYVNK